APASEVLAKPRAHNAYESAGRPAAVNDDHQPPEYVILHSAVLGSWQPAIPWIEEQQASQALGAESYVRTNSILISDIDSAYHSVLVLNPHVAADARALDAEHKAGRVRGPLHGVPILLKDNIESADDSATTAGSLALKDNVTNRDAPLVRRLTDAGALILGKTNLSEWANFRSSHSLSGWSAVGGQ